MAGIFCASPVREKVFAERAHMSSSPRCCNQSWDLRLLSRAVGGGRVCSDWKRQFPLESSRQLAPALDLWCERGSFRKAGGRQRSPRLRAAPIASAAVAAPPGAPEETAAAAAEGVSLGLPSPAVRIPQSIHDISNGDHILGFGAELSEGHPGFHDEEYKRRRAFIADLAKQHVIGEPVPFVAYTAAETATWAHVLEQLTQLYPTHACREYLAALPLFNFRPDRIPQLQELSAILKERTGWQIRPVAGLLHPRDFLNGLAFRYFHSTQYIRHGSQPMYTPEPDVCHELLGHVPMLADPAFADLAQAIGVASLGASEKDIWHLTKLYWYTVEFGTVLEGSQVKAFGAGLLSSYGELQWMRSGDARFVPLDPFAPLPKMSYKDGFQKTYFLCPSFADVAQKLQAYARSIKPADAADRLH